MSNSIRRYILENDPIKHYTMFGGVPIDIEWEKGETRSYPGSPHRNFMGGYSYGYVPNTTTEDHEDLDVLLYDVNGQKKWVGELTQLNAKTGKFDEFKYGLGFPSVGDLRDSYIDTMEPAMFGGITVLTWKEFLSKIQTVVN